MAANDYLEGIDNERSRLRAYAREQKAKLAKLSPGGKRDDWYKGYLEALEDLEKDLDRADQLPG